MRVETFDATDRVRWLALRERDVTASVAGALLGVHDYQTPYGLWALKSGRVQEDPDETAPMRRGRLLEPVALQMLAEDRPGWTIRPGRQYFRAPDLRIGATPDAFATRPDRQGEGIVQIKTTTDQVFRRKWVDPEGDPDEPVLPLWIAVQANVEARLTGAAWAAVGVLIVGHGLDLRVIDVPIHDGIWARLKAEVSRFWAMVEAGEEPEIDPQRDGAAIAAVYSETAERVVDLGHHNDLPELLIERAALRTREEDGREAKERRQAIDAVLIHRLQGASRGALRDGTTISAAAQHRPGHYVPASTFRSVRVRGPLADPRPEIPDRF